MRHVLYSWQTNQPIKTFDSFDARAIKANIILHLKANPKDTLEHYKEFSKPYLNKYLGHDVLSLYRCSHDGAPCRVVKAGEDDSCLRRLTYRL